MSREILKYSIPTCVYFYSPNMGAASLTYDGKPIVGEWYGHYVRGGIASEVTADEHTFFEPGRNFFDLIMRGDTAFVEHLEELFEKVIATADEFQALSYSDHVLGNVSDLSVFYKKYCEVFVPVFAMGYSLDFYMDRYMKEHSINASEVVPMGQSFIAKEKADLKKVFELESAGDTKAFEVALRDHSLKYSWILNNYTGEHIAGVEYFLKRKSEVMASDIAQAHPVTRPTTLTEWISYLTYMRDERKRLNLISIGLFDRYVSARASKLGVERDSALMLTIDEFESGPMQATKQGEDRYIHISRNGPRKATKSEYDAFAEESISWDGTLTGQIACRGVARGVARIVISSADFAKVDKGDVVVASMTRPEFAPVLHKCSAIVTNEGGVTCHAAIVSRELRIPCIIGTKIATRVLKDDDMIEVDAERGVVKIIS